MKKTKQSISLRRPIIFALVAFMSALVIAVGAFVYLFLDIGGEKVVVEIPSFVGMSITDVEKQGIDGIRIEKNPVFSDEYNEGIIISQTPAPSSKRVMVSEEIVVNLRVSLGKEQNVIPDLESFDAYEAAAVLREMGLAVRFVAVYDSELGPDKVISTSPQKEEVVSRGDSVTLFVSRRRSKPSVRVRDLVGMRCESAIARLMADGLTLGRIIYLPTESEYEGVVIAQSIPKDALVRWGSKIDITVAESGEALGFYNGDTAFGEDTSINGE